MGFRINPNLQTLDANKYLNISNKRFGESVSNMSSGLRLRRAEDDAGSFTIANSIRSQASSLNQAVKNTNDGIGIIKISDYAMEEQIKILELIKAKAIQAAHDGQNANSRASLQEDIVRLTQTLDHIAKSTSFNNIKLLNGTFTNREFQIGAYSQNTSKTSIAPTMSTHIGHTRFETGTLIDDSGRVDLRFLNTNGDKKLLLEPAYISYSSGTGIGSLAKIINANSDQIGGIRAKWNLITTGTSSVTAGNVQEFKINGIAIGNIDIQSNDGDGVLMSAVNSKKSETGVEAYIDSNGGINFRSLDGRGVIVSSANGSVDTLMHINANNEENYGRLTLMRNDSTDIWVSSVGDSGFQIDNLVSQNTLTLAQGIGQMTIEQANAAGFFANSSELAIAAASTDNLIEAGVNTINGAMSVVAMAQSAMDRLENIRSEIGAIQQELSHTVKNIELLAVNLKSSESYIRDIDFASESVEFNKVKILSQLGNYALSQSHINRQQALKLLQ
jgi:flagellin